MPIYLIVLKEPSSKSWDVVKKNFGEGRNYIIDNKVAFVSTESPTNTGNISRMLGLTDEAGGTGFVLSIDEPVLMAGRHDRDLWEWVKSHGRS